MTFPLKEHPTWKIYDSSKLDTYVTCPRQYLQRYVFGWEPDVPAHDLHFGSCWHLAREHQLRYGYDKVKDAFDRFLTEYRKEFDPETDPFYLPKTPTAVLNALMKFATERSRDLIENRLVHLNGVPMTEISGTVPISDTRVMHYRLDDIMERVDDGKIFSWDHKTTTAKYIEHRMWTESFHLSIQNGTYTHCLYCMFPVDRVLGIEFCGAGFEFLTRGSKDRPAGYYCTLKRIPAFKTPEQMNVWLWNVNDIVDNIERDMDRLFHCKESDPVLMAFQQNPKSCTGYRGCPYHDFCLAWANPLRYVGEPPLGFRVSYWNPEDRPASVKRNLELPK